MEHALANRSWKKSQDARMQNRREEKKLSEMLGRGTGIELSHKSEVKSVTREQKRIQRELDKIKKGMYKKITPHEIQQSGFSKQGNKLNPLKQADKKKDMLTLPSPNDRRNESLTLRRGGSVSGTSEIAEKQSGQDSRRRSSYAALNDEDIKRIQERVKQFTGIQTGTEAGDDIEHKVTFNVEVEKPSLNRIDIDAVKNNINKRLGVNLHDRPVLVDPAIRTRPTTSASPLPLEIPQDKVFDISKDTVEEFLLNPVFNADLYNPDGHLRTMYTMPSIEGRFREASKARYIRGNKSEPKPLTAEEIFEKP